MISFISFISYSPVDEYFVFFFFALIKSAVEKAMATHFSTLAWNSHGWRSLVGCSCSESDTIERLHFYFSLSCSGEGNGNPLQCSCLENPRDGGSLVGCRLMGSHRVRHNWSDLAAANCAVISFYIFLKYLCLYLYKVHFQILMNLRVWIILI